MRRMIGWYGIVLLGLFAVEPLGAQRETRAPAPKPGRIVGVFDEESGAPIVGAEVMDLFADSLARTEIHGLVELSHFRSHNDSALVSISKAGFVDTTLVVLVGVADTVPLQVNLHRADVMLPATLAMVLGSGFAEREQRAFDARRATYSGIFFTADDLLKQQGRSISDVLAENTKCPYVSVNAQRDPYGRIQYWDRDSRQIATTMKRDATDYQAVEIYDSNIPLVLTDPTGSPVPVNGQIPLGLPEPPSVPVPPSRRSRDGSKPTAPVVSCAIILWTRLPSLGGGE